MRHLLDYRDLARVDIFSELAEEQLRLIFDLLLSKFCQAGEVLFHEGEPGETVYFVSQGRVKISTVAADGKEKILHFMEPGQVFGEVVLFEGGRYPATAVATEDSQVGALNNSALYSLLQGNGDLCISLLRLLARRLRAAQRQVHDLALKDVYTRVGELILRLAEESGQPETEAVKIRLTATREELANLAGTTRETFTRMLAIYREQELIRTVKGGLILPSLSNLRDELDLHQLNSGK